MQQTPLLAMTTCPDASAAARVAETLVREHLAACVNQIPGLISVYSWQEQLHRDSEILLLIKTTQERLGAVESRLKELHPYELPELIALPICGGSTAYLDWLRQNTASTAIEPQRL